MGLVLVTHALGRNGEATAGTVQHTTGATGSLYSSRSIHTPVYLLNAVARHVT